MVEHQLLLQLQSEYFGEAPTGTALLVPSERTERQVFVVFAFVGSTDTSEYPSNYIYTCLRGALLSIGRHNDAALKAGTPAQIKSLGVPFLSTYGKVASLELSHCEVARQMALALDTTPTYVFSSYKASQARARVTPDKKEQQRRMKAQISTDEQLYRAVSKAVARAVRKGSAEDFGKLE